MRISLQHTLLWLAASLLTAAGGAELTKPNVTSSSSPMISVMAYTSAYDDKFNLAAVYPEL